VQIRRDPAIPKTFGQRISCLRAKTSTSKARHHAQVEGLILATVQYSITTIERRGVEERERERERETKKGGRRWIIGKRRSSKMRHGSFDGTLVSSLSRAGFLVLMRTPSRYNFLSPPLSPSRRPWAPRVTAQTQREWRGGEDKIEENPHRIAG